MTDKEAKLILHSFKDIAETLDKLFLELDIYGNKVQRGVPEEMPGMLEEMEGETDDKHKD